MRKQRFVALGAALSLLFPFGAGADVRVVEDQWQLIGVAGLASITNTTTGTVQTPNLSYSTTSQVLVDYRDTWNLTTWDRTTGTTSYNGVALSGANTQFANNAESHDGVDLANAPTAATDTDDNGLPYHATVGVRSINVGSASTLVKTAIGFTQEAKSSGSPIRTMYVVSPYSNGEPDVMIAYQADRETDGFKISFKNNDTAWNFATSATNRDDVYAVTFSRDNTYDNPLNIASLQPISTTTTGGDSNTSYYSAVSQIFDMNLSEGTPDADTKVAWLDGTLTIYGYTGGTSGVWKVGAFSGDGTDVSVSAGSNMTDLEAGYGYWVRFVNGSATYTTATDSQAGFFTGANDSTPAAYAGKLKEGWNLLAFNDGYLRHATSGMVITTIPAGLNVFSPNGDANMTFPGGAGAPTSANCGLFNQYVEGNNSLPTKKNNLDVRCYFDAATPAAVLISDKPFFVAMNVPGDVAANVTSLAGSTYATTDAFDHNGSTGAAYAYMTYRGEYAIGLERNADWDELGLQGAAGAIDELGRIAMGVPAWNGVAAATAGVRWDLNTTAQVNTVFGALMTNTGLDTPANGQARAGRVIEVDTQATGVAPLMLFAANNRFWVREDTAIRLFDTNEVNSTALTVLAGSPVTTAATGAIGFVIADGSTNCDALVGAINGLALDVHGHCLARNGDDEDNQTLMIYSPSLQNFDVREASIASELLFDRHIGQTSVALDENRSVQGAVRRVYHASNLAQAPFFNIAAVAEVTNVTLLAAAAITDGDFIQFNTSAPASVCYYFDPTATYAGTPGCGTDINVTGITAVSTADQVAAAFQAVLGANFTAPVPAADTVVVTHVVAGAAVDATVTGVAAFGITVATQGEDAVFGLTPVAAVDNLTYTTVWAQDFPNNGAIYQLAGNTFKPEMIITAVTSDGELSANAAGTITWKALDLTRDPNAWHDENNDFGLFWTESDRGYWVYLDAEGSFTNPVTVAAPTMVSTVHKHFDNVLSASGEGTVFNWADATMTSSVGGLVRTGYTSGQSYNVIASLGGREIGAMTTTGAIASSAAANFTIRMNDFEVADLRPNALYETSTKASDGLGGRNEATATFAYAQPQTPVLSFNGATLVVSSNPTAATALVFEGNLSDMNPNRITAINAAFADVSDGVREASIDLTTVSTLGYPADVTPLPETGTVPDFDAAVNAGIIKDLRVIASTGAADAVSGGIASGSSVYSNMRRTYYMPIYSQTGHLMAMAASGATVTNPVMYNVTGYTNGAAAGRDFGVQFDANTTLASNNDIAVVFQPDTSATLDQVTPTHMELYIDNNNDGTGDELVGTLTYGIGQYEGQPFYVFIKEDAEDAVGQWYYGVFQGGAWNTGNGAGLTPQFQVTLEAVSTANFGLQLSF